MICLCNLIDLNILMVIVPNKRQKGIIIHNNRIIISIISLNSSNSNYNNNNLNNFRIPYYLHIVSPYKVFTINLNSNNKTIYLLTNNLKQHQKCNNQVLFNFNPNNHSITNQIYCNSNLNNINKANLITWLLKISKNNRMKIISHNSSQNNYSKIYNKV